MTLKSRRPLLLHAYIAAVTILHAATIIFFLVGLGKKKKRGSGEKPFVSVVIAAHNEEANVRECLLSTLSQSYPEDRYEVILLDDRSDDRTAEIARELTEQHHNLRVIGIDSVPAGMAPKKHALTTGVESSRGEIIFETDADSTVDEKWLESTVRIFDKDVGMVAGASAIRRVRGGFLESFQALDFLMLIASSQGALASGLPLGATGQNLAYRKIVFEEVGGLETDVHRYVSNDILFLHKVAHTGWKIVGAPEAKPAVQTLPLNSWKDFISQRTRWSSNAYWKGISPLLLLVLISTYALNLTVAAGIVLMILGKTFLPLLASLIIYKFLTEGVFCLASTSLLGRKDLRRWFPAWFVAVTPYVILMGILGFFGAFRWKGYSTTSSKRND